MSSINDLDALVAYVMFLKTKISNIALACDRIFL